jgi:hypothetical protein
MAIKDAVGKYGDMHNQKDIIELVSTMFQMAAATFYTSIGKTHPKTPEEADAFQSMIADLIEFISTHPYTKE